MAKVEMDLAELKALEKSIENLEKEKQDLIDRQHQVIVYHKYFNGKIKLGEKKLFDQNRVNIQAIRWSNYGNLSSEYIIDDNISFQSLLDKGLIEIDISEISSKTSKDYINMSEAIDQVRKEEEEKLQSQIDELKRKCRSLEVSAETLVEDSKKEVVRIRKNYEDSKEELTNTFNEKIANLLKEKDILLKEADLKYNILKEHFEDFKADKKRLSLEDQILELTNQLKAEKDKGFWSKLFK